MDFIEPILSVASAIYTLADNVKANKKHCHRVADRVKAIEYHVKSMGDPKSEGVQKALIELRTILESARDLIKKYTEDKKSLFKRLLKSSSHKEDFMAVNDRLNDASTNLMLAMQVKSAKQSTILCEMFEKSNRQMQDEVDRREDEEEIKRFLLEYLQKEEERMEALRRDVISKLDKMNISSDTEVKQRRTRAQTDKVGRHGLTLEFLKKEEERMEALRRDVINKVDKMNRPSADNEERRMIKPEELRYSEVPPKPFMVTAHSELYKGEYRGFTVAIKRFTDQADTSLSEIQAVFEKDVETMKHFESPNILRMFGICVWNEEGPNPEYLIIMEYCEMGSLRQVLDSGCELSWMRKARMCLDAAQGLYRLHQTEDKSKVHGYISSRNFFVDESYRVKLGGFELAQTETSLKRGRNYNEVRSWCYKSPQILNSIDVPYSKECEVYSLGIVMWEIATLQHPFEDPVTKVKWTNKEIRQRVGKDKYIEPLPEDCPEALRDLINACRAYESFHRPSAGVLMDKLRIVVAQLE